MAFKRDLRTPKDCQQFFKDPQTIGIFPSLVTTYLLKFCNFFHFMNFLSFKNKCESTTTSEKLKGSAYKKV